MIQINVLPHEFRRGTLQQTVQANRALLTFAGIAFLGLTLLFYVQYLVGTQAERTLEKRWEAVQEQVERLVQMKSEIEGGIQRERDFLENRALSVFPTTAILDNISLSIPDSVWLVELKATRGGEDNTLLLKGYALPTQGPSSIHDIEMYLKALKEKFPKDTNVILTTTRQQQEKTEVTLFTAILRWGKLAQRPMQPG